MKPFHLLAATLLAAPVFVRADVDVSIPELQRIGYLPQDKADLRPEDKLDMKRRNPFAEKTKPGSAAKNGVQEDTEDSRLRQFFEKNKVTGLMKLGDKHIATLGRLALETGQTLPPLIPGQTQILRVIRVDEKMLEVGWVEDATFGTPVPRKIVKRIELDPVVEMVLASEDNPGDKAQTYFTDAKGRTVQPPNGVFPNPSSIADSLPPGSDTDPNSVLTDGEHSDLTALEMARQAPPAAPPAPAPVPDASPEPAPPAPAGDPPPSATEDEVQPDPDLSSPGSVPAGAPQK